MAKKGKKQSAADAAFIAKIATIGINTSGSKNKTCPDCGGDMDNKEQVGYLKGEMHGEIVEGPVYAHKKGPGPRGTTPAAPDEQSFSA